MRTSLQRHSCSSMKFKHLKYWLQQTTSLARLSECSRRQFGCVIIDPGVNSLVADGYNGAARGGPSQCGGERVCMRDMENIPSGERLARGCNHAEANAIANAARRGTPLEGCWLLVNGEPCLACAKLIYHAGISRVVYIGGGYSSSEGVEYLRSYIPIYAVDLENPATIHAVL